MQGSRERPMRREAAQIFEHENVRFPRVHLQGRGQLLQGPSKLKLMSSFCSLFIVTFVFMKLKYFLLYII